MVRKAFGFDTAYTTTVSKRDLRTVTMVRKAFDFDTAYTTTVSKRDWTSVSPRERNDDFEWEKLLDSDVRRALKWKKKRFGGACHAPSISQGPHNGRCFRR